MKFEGDLVYARETFLRDRFPNLDFLLRNRYEWMNEYIKEGFVTLELGCGAGFSPLYLKEKPILTDTEKQGWVDKVVDATKMELEDESVDVLIASHIIHHFYSPYKFFMEALRVLKEGGVILIQEINTSLAMRAILRVMRHEGYGYNVDVFDENAVANDPRDPWSANCAIAQLLFSDEGSFEEAFTLKGRGFKIEKNEPCECFIFPLSGGVIAKTRVPKLPYKALEAARFLDNILNRLLPSIFAMGRRVVVRKVEA